MKNNKEGFISNIEAESGARAAVIRRRLDFLLCLFCGRTIRDKDIRLGRQFCSRKCRKKLSKNAELNSYIHYSRDCICLSCKAIRQQTIYTPLALDWNQHRGLKREYSITCDCPACSGVRRGPPVPPQTSAGKAATRAAIIAAAALAAVEAEAATETATETAAEATRGADISAVSAALPPPVLAPIAAGGEIITDYDKINGAKGRPSVTDAGVLKPDTSLDSPFCPKNTDAVTALLLAFSPLILTSDQKNITNSNKTPLFFSPFRADYHRLSQTQTEGERDMGKKNTGTLYRNGSYWWICIPAAFFADKKRVKQSLGTKDRAEAERLFAQRMAPFLALSQVQRKRQLLHQLADAEDDLAAAANAVEMNLPLKDALAAYLQKPGTAPAAACTLRDYEYHWRRLVRWAEGSGRGDYRLKDLTPADCEAFAADLLSEGLSMNRFRKVLATASRLVARLIPKQPNPFRGISADLRRRAVPAESRRAFSTDELKTIFKYATGELRLLMALGLYTGFRLGDCAEMKWSDIDLQANRISRQPNKTKSRSGRIVMVEIHCDLRALLLEAQSTAGGDDVLPHTAGLYRRSRSHLSRSLTRFFADTCGFQTTEARKNGKLPVKRLDFHSLRHSFASMAAAAGADAATLQAVLGHNSTALQRVYVHVGRPQIKAAVDSLPSINGSPELLALPAGPAAALPAPINGKLAEAIRVLETGQGGKKPELAAAVIAALALLKGN